MAVSAEVYLVSSIVLNGEYKTALAAGMTNDMFHTCADEIKWLAAYWGKYKTTPSRAAFKRAFPSFGFKDVHDTGHFVEEVRKSHARARMTELMKDQADLIAAGQVTEATALGMAGMVSIAADMGEHEEVDAHLDWKPLYNEVRARKVRYEELGMAGIPTGFETLDQRTGGIGRGQSWIYAARLGEGKSYKLLETAVAAVLAGYKVHFAALEMSRSEVQMRYGNLLAKEIGFQVFESEKLQQGHGFDLKEYRRFLEAIPKMVKGHFTVSDARNIGEMEICAQIERNQPDLYILDYMTLGKMSGDGGWQDISKFSKGLKIIGGRYQVGMLSAAQLNRQGTDKNAGTETIGGSDAIGQDADAVVMLRKMSTRVTEMRVAKWRHGRSGYKFYSFLDLQQGVRHELTKDQAEEIKDQDLQRLDDEEKFGAAQPKKKRLGSVPPVIQKSIQQESMSTAAYSMPRGAGRTGMRRKS